MLVVYWLWPYELEQISGKVNSVRQWGKQIVGLMRKWRVAGTLVFVAQVLGAMPVS